MPGGAAAVNKQELDKEAERALSFVSSYVEGKFAPADRAFIWVQIEKLAVTKGNLASRRRTEKNTDI